MTEQANLPGGIMPPTIQVGTVLIDDSPLITRFFGLESEACSGTWSVVKLLDGFALDRRIHAAGWNFFFMAAEVKVMFLGAVGAKKIQNALVRILGKVKQQHFNGLEVTGIVAKRFLGLRYATVSAHSRHIQQGWRLDGAEARRLSQRDTEWARG
ncbi:MAG: hypothetical protein DMG97_08715 [Acidobacteria bacterium]|nr:MAG: hypothetical protein DMG98_00075 [Acidobacteriota bacterium]PYV74477.1 MAG: hypothetical protein DMG97_08715 [Acidobacteriota bacterium]